MAEINEIKPAVGQIQIADEVIAIIAATAAFEVEGVGAAQGGGISEFFGKKASQTKGVKVTVEGDEVRVDIEISVKYGINLQETALKVQEKIKNAVETMTGLSVTAVDVRISAVTVEKKIEPEAE